MRDREQERKIRHRLAVLRDGEGVSGDVAATYRYYGINRTLFYEWRNRFDELGAEGWMIAARGLITARLRRRGSWSSG